MKTIKDKTILPVIMCGGVGSRLWPLSTPEFPKSFIKTNDKFSFFQKTVHLASLISNVKNIVIISNFNYRFIIANQIKDLKLSKDITISILTEPFPKNTSSAVLISSLFVKNFLKQSNIIFLPSDFLLTNQKIFMNVISRAKSLLNSDNIILVGNQITKKIPGFGYINYTRNNVNEFVEKPNDTKLNNIWKNKKNYLINMGIFIGNVNSFIESFNLYSNNTHKKMLNIYKNIKADTIKIHKEIKFFNIPKSYNKLPSISFDHDILQKHHNLNVLKFAHKWNDYGGYDSYLSLITKKTHNLLTNLAKKLILTFDSNDNALYSTYKNKKYILSGINSSIIIDTNDGLIIIEKSTIEKFNAVKSHKEFLSEKNKEPYFDARPWGNFKIISNKPGYKIKLLTIYPGMSLSLQKHKYRSEHWVIIEGCGSVYNGKDYVPLKKNESFFVEKGNIHQLSNESKKNNLIIVEVQTGNKISESDITRINDPYDR